MGTPNIGSYSQSRIGIEVGGNPPLILLHSMVSIIQGMVFARRIRTHPNQAGNLHETTSGSFDH